MERGAEVYIRIDETRKPCEPAIGRDSKIGYPTRRGDIRLALCSSALVGDEALLQSIID